MLEMIKKRTDDNLSWMVWKFKCLTAVVVGEGVVYNCGLELPPGIELTFCEGNGGRM